MIIKLVITDIDGVLTDGRVSLFSGTEVSLGKTLCFRDFDSVSILKKCGVGLCIITGEDDWFVDEVEKRFCPIMCIRGCKDKSKAVCNIADSLGVVEDEIAYIGDGKYDINAMRLVGLSVCPSDAIREAKQEADIILSTKGGYGCLAELFSILQEKGMVN